MFSSLPGALQLLLAPLLLFHNTVTPPDQVPAAHIHKTFHLRHQHAISNDSRILLSDVPASFLSSRYRAKTQVIKSFRPSSLSAFNDARRRVMESFETPADLWGEVDVPAPDTEDRATLLELAKMSNNAYFEPGSKGWYTLDPTVNNVSVCRSSFIYILMSHWQVVSIWLGTGCGWLQRARFCLRRQFDSCACDQRNLSRLASWRWRADREERQA